MVRQIGIPVFFYVLLRLNHPLLKQRSTKVSAEELEREERLNQARLGFLFDGYQKEAWYFELVRVLCRSLRLRRVLGR